MFGGRKTRISAALATMAVAVAVAAAPASAAPQQGLVNVNVEDLVVQVPIGVAANICDVNVAVLVNDLIDDSAACTASADPDATVTPGGGGGGGGPQSGLVNVNLANNTVQVPVAVAANVCDVNVDVLVSLVNDSASSCDADASSHAQN